ncbi:hypothetical protein [Streptomyces achromogenes]|uniref:hypothetical protein n=1 Tax=Streptomyces achromogenes TaxID=67255 RepID=UPI00367F453F
MGADEARTRRGEASAGAEGHTGLGAAEEKYDPVTGKLLGAGYDDHAAAVTSTAAELHRADIGHLLGFQTEVGHRLAGGFVQRADLVVRAPEAGVLLLLVEADRRIEDAHDLVAKLRRYWEWGRLLPKDADKHTVDLVCSRPDAIEHVGHDKRLWRRCCPPTGREGLVPVAFVFADTTEAKVANTVQVLEEAGHCYWAPRRYDTLCPKAVGRLCFRLKPGSYDTIALMEVLEHLKAFYRGEQVVLVGDGLSAHWSRAMRAWVAGQNWLTLE